MKSFLIGIGLAIVLAVATGVGLNLVEISSSDFNSTENVRL